MSPAPSSKTARRHRWTVAFISAWRREVWTPPSGEIRAKFRAARAPNAGYWKQADAAVLPSRKEGCTSYAEFDNNSPTRHMQVQSEVEKLVLVWVEDREILELVREFLEPLGYSVEFAPEASVAGKAAD